MAGADTLILLAPSLAVNKLRPLLWPRLAFARQPLGQEPLQQPRLAKCFIATPQQNLLDSSRTRLFHLTKVLCP